MLNLDTTKDGKWVLATFRKYLRLIPTENNDDDSLFSKKIPFDNRPSPIKLDISLQDLQIYGAKDFAFLPAKFDESKEGRERFIISGFGEYTVIWNLGRILRGDKSYLISKTEGKVLQAEFFYNNPEKIIMTTSHGITIKENQITKWWDKALCKYIFVSLFVWFIIYEASLCSDCSCSCYRSACQEIYSFSQQVDFHNLKWYQTVYSKRAIYFVFGSHWQWAHQ